MAGMHLIIPFACDGSPECLATLRGLALPGLQALLRQMRVAHTHPGDAQSLSMPHERVLAHAAGLPQTDGLHAMAAWQCGASPGEGCGWLLPCHWQIERHQVCLHPQALDDLQPADAAALLAAMQPYFQEDGLALQALEPGRWLVRGPALAQLATASFDRAAARNVEPWLPQGPGAAAMRRLQTEMQMLLYRHPVNAERERRGQRPMNAFWLHATGALPEDWRCLVRRVTR